jgi:manganese/zinc/iron transport system permease protein
MDVALSRLVELLSGDYMFAWWAMLAAATTGLFCGVIGVLLTLRRAALLGDAAAHATLPGLCAAFLVSGSRNLAVLLGGAMVSAVAAALLVGWLDQRPRTRPEANVAGVLAVAFGAGAWLLARVQESGNGAQAGLTSFLFGSAAAVAPGSAIGLTVVAAVLLLLVAAFVRPLSLATLDPVWAQTVGVPSRLIAIAIPAAAAAAVVLAAQAVGVVLVAAMLIIPPAAGLLASRSLPRAMVVSGAIGAGSGVIGGLASFVVPRLSTGPAMVLVAGAAFGVTLLARGARARWRPAAQEAP